MGFVNCLGIVASGKSSAGEPLSFLTHQDTPQLYHNKKMAERFYRDLYNQLMLLKRKAEYETLDAVIFGGNGYLDWTSSKMLDKYYDNGIQIVAKAIQDVLGFDAYIAHGPKQQGGHNDVFFDTEKNLLYIVSKLGLSSSYRPFLFSQLSEAKKVRKQFSYKN